MFGWLVGLLVTLSALGRPRHVGSKSPLLVSQVEDGGPQPQLGNLPPYELPMLRVNDTQPHQTVLVHSHQTPSSHLLLQETLGVEMVIVTTVSPQPLLHVNHRPGRVNSHYPRFIVDFIILPLLHGLWSLSIGSSRLLWRVGLLHCHSLKISFNL